MGGMSKELRTQMIAEAAYFRAEHRGFNGGDAVADWLEAEKEIDAEAGSTEASLGGLEQRLASANARLKAFRRRLTRMTSEAREEWEEDVEKLAKHRDRLRKRIKEIGEQSGHAADKARLKAEEAWAEASAVIDRLSRRKSGRP